MFSKETKDYRWIPGWIPDKKEIFGYPDSLIEARTAKAYEFALQNIDVAGKVVLDYGSGYGHGILRIGLERPKQLISTAQYQGSLNKQRRLFQPHIGDLSFVQSKDGLPFGDEHFDVVFLNHVIEHISPQLTIFFIEQLNRITKTSGVICVVTPNANEVIKPLAEGRDYNWQTLDGLLSKGFKQRKAFSLIPNNHSLSVHRRKQLVAAIPGTSKIRNIAPGNLWELAYGSALRKVRPSDFRFVEGYDESAIDFLVFCRK